MRNTNGNLALAGYGDIFNVGTADGEHITEIALSELHPPEFHPFQVNDDLSMTRLIKSIKQYGVREPGLPPKRKSVNRALNHSPNRALHSRI